MTTDSSKQCTLTNNSGKDMVVAVAIPGTETGSSNALPIAGGALEVLKTTTGETIIKSGASGTVTLDHSYKSGSTNSNYVQSYDLMACDAQWLNPLATLSVAQQSGNGTEGYAPQTLAAANPAMSQAFKFYQTIAVYPGSQLAQDYVKAVQAAKEAALNGADSTAGAASNVARAIDAAINTFFKNTAEYQQVTLAGVTAVDTYYKTFPAVWAQYKDTITYYLYGTAATKASFLGTLSLKKSGALDVTKNNGGYACSFAPATTADMNNTSVEAAKAVSLTYRNGLFVDDPNAASPKIALRGSFLLSRLLSQKPDDAKVRVVVTGSVAGTLCVGLDTAQRSTTLKPQVSAALDIDPTVVAFWNRLTHPQTLTDWVVTVMTFTSAVLAIPAVSFAVYRIYKLVKWKAQNGEALNRQAVADEVGTLDRADRQDRIKWTGEGQEGQNIADFYGLTMEQVEAIVSKGSLAQTLSGLFDVQAQCIREVMEYSSVMSAGEVQELQGLLTNVRKSYADAAKLIDASIYKDPGQLPQKLQKINEGLDMLGEYQTSLDEIYSRVKGNLKQESIEMVEESAQVVTGAATDIRKALEEDVVEEEARDPRVAEEIIPY